MRCVYQDHKPLGDTYRASVTIAPPICISWAYTVVLHSTMAYIHEHRRKGRRNGFSHSWIIGQVSTTIHLTKTLRGNPHLRNNDCLERMFYFLQPPLYFSILSLPLHIVYGFFYYYRSATLLQAELWFERLLNASPIHTFAWRDPPHVRSWITSEYRVLRRFMRGLLSTTSLDTVWRDLNHHLLF